MSGYLHRITLVPVGAVAVLGVAQLGDVLDESIVLAHIHTGLDIAYYFYSFGLQVRN